MNFVRSWDDLAQELGVSRKSLQNWRSREDLREKADFPRPRADGRHDVEAWRKFMIAHGLKRADEDVAPDDVPDERKSIRDWKEFREELMCTKLQREIARGDNILLVATDLEVPLGATFASIQTKLSQFPARAARFMLNKRDEASAQATLEDEMNAVLADLSLAEYMTTSIDAIAEEFPFNDECAELYNRVSFAGQDRAAFVALLRLTTLEVLRRIGKAGTGSTIETSPQSEDDKPEPSDLAPSQAKPIAREAKGETARRPRRKPKSVTRTRKRAAKPKRPDSPAR